MPTTLKLVTIPPAERVARFAQATRELHRRLGNLLTKLTEADTVTITHNPCRTEWQVALGAPYSRHATGGTLHEAARAALRHTPEGEP
jgi:hypothetical protein